MTLAANKMITFQQMALLVACVLIAGYINQGVQTIAAASSYEAQRIGLVFPREQPSPLQASQASQQQQLQPLLQRFQYQLYQQLRQQQEQQEQQQPKLEQRVGDDYQPRPDGVKRNLFLRGLRPVAKVTSPKPVNYDDFVSAIWEDTRSLRMPPASRVWVQPETRAADSGSPYQQANGIVDGTVGGRLASAGSNILGNTYNQRPQSQHHRAGTEEVALHMPIRPQSTGDYGWKRVENSRWNNLRGMWGKRSSPTISDENNNINNNNDNHRHELDDHKLEEKLKQELESVTAA